MAITRRPSIRNTRPSGAPLFIANPGILDEDNPAASDGISPHPGANRWLGNQAAHHDGQPRLADNANRVSVGSLGSIATLDGVAKPDAGRRDGRPIASSRPTANWEF
jgi:hypothetical protein